MNVDAIVDARLDPPGSREVRLTFLALWFVDMVAAALFFVVPYATELNPVTNYFYGLFGLAGVVLAALCYAGIVVIAGNFLPRPLDFQFLVAVVALYAMLVINNVLLLVLGEPVLAGLLPDLDWITWIESHSDGRW
ncbi:hypothetical protein [Natrarchaeobius oligotrophus]|uniref:Uncharacterized protein n=1 Tax=Natrarchaeobius chitinivorans TaxID=1679083 RepID=A0A3N6MIW0_NATCH|nr:hypothetical protein [Natrarchaeobius chitinivorans]RQG96930.1 hypothetical protein EA472_19675 [Natrarchaeobius chitinivorans]